MGSTHCTSAYIRWFSTLCGDYKVTLNQILLVDEYPSPHIYTLFTKLQGGIEFTKIDLEKAYLQLELDDESYFLTSIYTHKGLFMYNRSLMAAIYEKSLEQILQGIEGVVSFLDDILIPGENRGEHLSRSMEVSVRF
ncbi:hypothetical protein JTB14_013944 [Gonioctena quinquepunctata]|nr:hypothetical protein JTB14_013944 [Gonioctena quinquepunctata]